MLTVPGSQTLGLPSVLGWGDRQSQLNCRVCPHLSAQLPQHLEVDSLHLPVSLVETLRVPEREGCAVSPASRLKDAGLGLDLEYLHRYSGRTVIQGWEGQGALSTSDGDKDGG